MDDASQPKAPFSCLGYLVGFIVALLAGGIGDIVAWGIAGTSKSATLGVVLGVIPGIVILLCAYPARRLSIAPGLVSGGSVVLLLGGACGGFFGLMSQ